MDAVSPGLGESAASVAYRSIEQPFLGRWNQLVSTTNWEKGRIIHEWREALIAAGAPATDYSDDAWSRQVGAVTGQHVGRLRRVYLRFGLTELRHHPLYWSHFQAALDWDDAEMWLEGAAQNNWSVSDMRRMRWETLGAIASDRPRDDAIITAEVDEDFLPERASGNAERAESAEQVVGKPIPEDADFAEEDSPSLSRAHDPLNNTDQERAKTIPVFRPFERLADLPPDFAEAFDEFKVTILRHKSEGWQQISLNDVLGALEALKELALAPGGDER